MSEKKGEEDAFHQHNHEFQEQQTFAHQHQVPLYPATTTTTMTIVHQPAPQATVMMMMAVTSGPVYATGYSKITSVCLGLLQIVICCLSIAAATVAIVFEASRSEEGTGFWCGVVYGVAGSIAVAAGFKPLNELIIAAVVFSSVAIAFGITQLTLSVFSLLNMVSCSENFCITQGAAEVISTVAMGTFGFWELLFGVCLVSVGLRAVFCPPKLQTLVASTLPSVTVPLTSASVLDHSAAPGPSTAAAASGYEGLCVEQEEATGAASYEPLQTKSKFKD